MKTIIVYCTSHGTTEKVTQLLKKQLKGDVTTLNLHQTKYPVDIHTFDAVIIGGSIHAGNIQRKVKKFIKDNHEVLEEKSLGLFLCCMQEGDVAKQQFDHAFPPELRGQAVAKGLFGGEFLISKMNVLEKLIVKKVSGISEEASTLNHASILEFAEKMNQVHLN